MKYIIEAEILTNEHVDDVKATLEVRMPSSFRVVGIIKKPESVADVYVGELMDQLKTATGTRVPQLEAKIDALLELQRRSRT